MHDQLGVDVATECVAERDHLAELEGRIDVKQWERQPSRRKGLLRQANHHRRVLADRVEHHRVLTLGDDLAHDVNALGLELLQVAQIVAGQRA